LAQKVSRIDRPCNQGFPSWQLVHNDRQELQCLGVLLLHAHAMKKSFGLCMLALLIVPALALSSCDEEESKAKRMGKGFRLPKGSVEDGAVAFVTLGCNRCHSVKGADLPEQEGASEVHFSLGGEVAKVKSYGELVTAIIQPDHVVSPAYLRILEKEQRAGAESPMLNYNDQMTVRQLTDLVTFLRSHYEELYPEYSDYSPPY
jgi:sulfur-oxidizing protein SoxX